MDGNFEVRRNTGNMLASPLSCRAIRRMPSTSRIRSGFMTRRSRRGCGKSSIISFRRTLTRDTEVRGQPIRAGERVLVLYQSANRDEDVFPDADRFDVARHPNPHVAFGIGTHFCLGANLARLELRLMVQELVSRLPDLRVAPGAGPVRVASTLVRGIESLPVVFTPQ